MSRRSTNSLRLLLAALGALATPVHSQQPTHEAVLSENPFSTAGLASAPGGGVFVTWSERALAGPPPRNVLRALSLDADLATRLAFVVADDRSGPGETYFQCPVVARVGADRLAFAWMATTFAGRRIGSRVTTLAGVPVGPVRFAEDPTPDRDA